MFTNEQQYRVTQAASERLEKFLAQLPASEDGIPPQAQRARRDAAESQLQELQDQLAAYEALGSSSGIVLDSTTARHSRD